MGKTGKMRKKRRREWEQTQLAQASGGHGIGASGGGPRSSSHTSLGAGESRGTKRGGGDASGRKREGGDGGGGGGGYQGRVGDLGSGDDSSNGSDVRYSNESGASSASSDIDLGQAGDDASASAFSHVCTPNELAVTTRTLASLSRFPALYRTVEFRALRVALHMLQESAALQNQGKSWPGMVSDALRDCRWDDSLESLRKMRERQMIPKLGALCRWVRDCDAVSADDPKSFIVLDSVLRTADPRQVGVGDDPTTLVSTPLTADARGDKVVRWHVPWSPPELQGNTGGPTVKALHRSDQEPAQINSKKRLRYRRLFRRVGVERGPDRRPENKHDLVIHTSHESLMRFDDDGGTHVQRFDVPFAPGGFFLTDVLTPNECLQLMEAVESVGFIPDEPASGSRSILAHNVVWCVDNDLLGTTFDRVKRFLPQCASDIIHGGAPAAARAGSGPRNGGGGGGGCELAGLNARWRFYRYVPGAVYRPHIDGAWPGSGLSTNPFGESFLGNEGGMDEEIRIGDDAHDGVDRDCSSHSGDSDNDNDDDNDDDSDADKYVYDAFGDRWSKLTFVIYLNDDFEGGCTTFYTPSAEVGTLNARGVKPRAGCVLVFPHGEADGSLLHEGSALLDGCKYIVRTEVLYKVK
eukprot:TRINITY_DN371_c0_g2_i1.p1 TRINITY_DN371_c0_g2~~TRINITY_DN371_c0_g2_i1.p1  ORF type:complete len:637 (+),score=127.82 TRINITY_DN371_c0_g2_i1:146-2056(+)